MQRQTFARLLSALPYFQQLISHTLTLLELSEEESLGLMDATAHVLRLLCLLLHFQKRFGLSPELLGVQLQAALEYDASIVTVFGVHMPSETAPLLDTLSAIDQEFSEPENMPSYLNVRLQERLHARIARRTVGCSDDWGTRRTSSSTSRDWRGTFCRRRRRAERRWSKPRPSRWKEPTGVVTYVRTDSAT